MSLGLELHTSDNRICVATCVFNFSLERRESKSRDSSVGIAIGYGLDEQGFGVSVPVRSKIFSSPSRPDRLWGSSNPGGNAA
jgi:hypothetical protein